jgi:hypothetical protein
MWRWISLASLHPMSRNLIIGEFRHLRQMPQQSNLQGTISMYGDRQANHTSRLAVNVVTAANAKQTPAAPLDQASEVPAG